MLKILAASKVFIEAYNGVLDPFPTNFYASELGPDCRIYIRPGSGSNVFHVINKPNEKGKACDFVQQGIRLPYVSARGSFPRHPRFRVDEEEKCDPSISTFLGEDVYYRRDLTVYPNPTRGPVTVEVPKGQKGSLHVLDIQGRHIGPVIQVDTHGNAYLLDASAWPVGTYSVEFVPDDNSERLIYTSWVVRQ